MRDSCSKIVQTGAVWPAVAQKCSRREPFGPLLGKSRANGSRLGCFRPKVGQTGAVWPAVGQKSVRREAAGALWRKSGSNAGRLARFRPKVGRTGAGRTTVFSGNCSK